jgi:hypothetical protein
MNALVASIIRTLVPHIVTQIASLFLMLNIQVPDDIRLQLSGVVGFVLFAIYYGGVRILEQQWPGIGVLLGLTASPDTYSKGNDTPAEAAKQTSLAATAIDAPAINTSALTDPAPESTFPKTAVENAQAAQSAPVAPSIEVPGAAPAVTVTV